MTTLSPLASVVLSIAICGCFKLVPLSLLLLIFCSQLLFPAPPAWPRNPGPKQPRRGDSSPHRPPRVPRANPSSLRCAPPPRHNLSAKGAQSTPRAGRAVRNSPTPGASAAEAPALLHAASCRPRSLAEWPLPSTRERSQRPALPRRDRAAFSSPRCARESRRERERLPLQCAPLEHRPQSQRLFHPGKEPPPR